MNSRYRRFLFQSKSNYHIYVGESYTGSVKPHRHEFHQCMYICILLKGKFWKTSSGGKYYNVPVNAFLRQLMLNTACIFLRTHDIIVFPFRKILQISCFHTFRVCAATFKIIHLQLNFLVKCRDGCAIVLNACLTSRATIIPRPFRQGISLLFPL